MFFNFFLFCVLKMKDKERKNRMPCASLYSKGNFFNKLLDVLFCHFIFGLLAFFFYWSCAAPFGLTGGLSAFTL